MSVVRRQNIPGLVSTGGSGPGGLMTIEEQRLAKEAEQVRSGEIQLSPGSEGYLREKALQEARAQIGAGIYGDLGRARESATGVPIKSDDPLRTRVREGRKSLAERITGQAQQYKDRMTGLADQRREAQFGNLAQFFARLGTDVSPGAQVGGLRGLLGAGVSAGEETLPEVLATQEEYAGRETALADQIAQAEIQGLQAELGVEEAALEEEKEIRETVAAQDQAMVTLGTNWMEVQADILAAEADYAAMGGKQADVGRLRKEIAASFNVEYRIGPDGEAIFGGIGNAKAHAKMYPVFLDALKYMSEHPGGAVDARIYAAIDSVRSRIDDIVGQSFVTAEDWDNRYEAYLTAKKKEKNEGAALEEYRSEFGDRGLVELYERDKTR